MKGFYKLGGHLTLEVIIISTVPIFYTTATIDMPMPGPVGVQLVNRTPNIDRGSVSVNFVTMGPTDTVNCELGDYRVVEDCKSVVY